MQRRIFLTQTAAAAAAVAAPGVAHATWTKNQPSAVVQWNRLIGVCVSINLTPVTIAARIMAMVHEAIYNAWAHYDLPAGFTQPWLFKRPVWEWNDINRRVAISHAAHGVLTDFFPAQVPLFEALLQPLIADAWRSNGGWQAGNVGRDAACKVLQSRNNDGANQRGDLAPGAYADYTGYAPVNTPGNIVDLSRWTPLIVPNAAGQLVTQQFLTPHWGRVRPFALRSGSVYRPTLAPVMPSQAEIDEILQLSADLTDRTKALGDFFAANPGSVTPPGQWLQFAEMVSEKDGNTLEEDVKLFFSTAQACLDVSIAVWDAKRAYDQARPATVIPVLYRGQQIRAWGGPGRGTQTILGEQWIPWQRPSNRSPPFPDFVSGHSTFSAAAATAIAEARGSDKITLSATVPAGAFRTDPGLPLKDITFTWKRLSEAADAAGYSRRLTGIHWFRSDFAGRTLGKQVGQNAASKCKRLFVGITV